MHMRERYSQALIIARWEASVATRHYTTTNSMTVGYMEDSSIWTDGKELGGSSFGAFTGIMTGLCNSIIIE